MEKLASGSQVNQITDHNLESKSLDEGEAALAADQNDDGSHLE